jgi:outer membrane protein assembly factor BamB
MKPSSRNHQLGWSRYRGSQDQNSSRSVAGLDASDNIHVPTEGEENFFTNFGLYGATDTTTGKVVWKIKIAQPAKSGVLIAGDLVFFGEGNGKFHAVDAATGKMLFTFDGTSIKDGGGAQAAPVAYVVKGRDT